MAQVIVYHDGVQYTVENALDTRTCITQDLGNGQTRGIELHVGSEALGFGVDLNQAVNQKLMVTGIVTRTEAGTGIPGGSTSNFRVSATFKDEAKVNASGFSNYLKRVVINQVFNQLLGIEPIDESNGTVVAPYNAP